jgi:hypothetical protein
MKISVPFVISVSPRSTQREVVRLGKTPSSSFRVEAKGKRGLWRRSAFRIGNSIVIPAGGIASFRWLENWECI